MRLKLMPIDTASQKILEWQVSVNGEPVEWFRRNSFGEMEAVWIRHDRLDNAVIVAEGLAETGETSGVLGHGEGRVPSVYFLRETQLTQTSDAIRDMALSCRMVRVRWCGCMPCRRRLATLWPIGGA